MAEQHLPRGRNLQLAALVLFAAAPLLAATGLLQVLGPLQGPVGQRELETLTAAVSKHQFLPGAMTYVALTTIHLFTCLVSIAFAWLVLRSSSHWRRFAGLGIGMAAFLLLLIVGLAWRSGQSVAAFRLSYLTFVDLYRNTGAEPSLLYPRVGPLTPLSIAAFFPTALGIASVALTAAAATSQLAQVFRRSFQTAEEEEAQLCLVHSRIKRCAYLLSLVLVTSTVSAALFFQMPSKLYLSEEASGCCTAAMTSAAHVADATAEATARDADIARKRVELTRKRVEAFGAELTTFWGAVYTLTLMAAVGVPLLLVQKHLRDFLEQLKPPERAEETRRRLAETGVLAGGGEQAKTLIAFVAPLVSAPVMSFLQATVG